MAVDKLIVGKKYKFDYEGWVKDFYKQDYDKKIKKSITYNINSIMEHDADFLRDNKILECAYINYKKIEGGSLPMYFKGMKYKNDSLSSKEGNDCWWMCSSMLNFMTPVNEIEDYEV